MIIKLQKWAGVGGQTVYGEPKKLSLGEALFFLVCELLLKKVHGHPIGYVHYLGRMTMEVLVTEGEDQHSSFFLKGEEDEMVPLLSAVCLLTHARQISGANYLRGTYAELFENMGRQKMMPKFEWHHIERVQASPARAAMLLAMMPDDPSSKDVEELVRDEFQLAQLLDLARSEGISLEQALMLI
ncbi:MAG: hypothetical protein WCV84_04190 [Patescibacteria group bacterium]